MVVDNLEPGEHGFYAADIEKPSDLAEHVWLGGGMYVPVRFCHSVLATGLADETRLETVPSSSHKDWVFEISRFCYCCLQVVVVFLELSCMLFVLAGVNMSGC